MAMAAWTANAVRHPRRLSEMRGPPSVPSDLRGGGGVAKQQTVEPVASGRVREVVKRLDHHANEIMAEGLR